MKSSVQKTVTVSKADKARILADHEKDMRQNPKGVQQLEFPPDVLEKVLEVAALTGYTLNETVIFLIRNGLPGVVADILAKREQKEWLANAPKGGAK